MKILIFFPSSVTTWQTVRTLAGAAALSPCAAGRGNDCGGSTEMWGVGFDQSKRWLCVWEESEPERGDKIEVLVRAGACSLTFEWNEGKQAAFAWSSFDLGLCSEGVRNQLRTSGCLDERDHVLPRKAAGKSQQGLKQVKGSSEVG